MKTCPKCGELIGDDVKECFNCHYNYTYGRIINPAEIARERERAQQAIQQKIASREVREQRREAQLQKNPKYEYETVVINDLSSGEADSDTIQKTLSEYSEEGWRLHSIFTNEIGKSSATAIVSFLGMSINATIDQTILIFERCIDAGSNDI